MAPRSLLPAALAGLALAALALVPAHAERDDKAAKPSAAKLVEQLGDDSFQVRKKAYEQLEAMGAPALEALKKGMESTDLEVSKKSKELYARIEKNAAAAAVLAAKQVHLVYKDTPLADAVADLKKKTGYAVVLHDPEGKLKDKKVTLDTGKVTFWEALEKFCDAAGVAEGDPTAGAMGLPGGPPGVVPGGRPGLPPPPGGNAAPPRQLEKPVKKDAPAAEDDEDAKKAEIQKRLEAELQARRAAAQAKAAQPRRAIAPAPPPGGPPGIGGPGMPGGPGGVMRPWVPVPQGQITLVPGKAKKVEADQKTSFRFRPGKHESLSALPDEYLAVLEVTLEPRIRWLSLTEVKVTKAVDENGDTLKQAESKAAPGGPGGFPGALPGGGGPAIMPIGPGPGGVAPGFPGGGRFVYTPQSANGLTHFLPVRLQKGAKAAKSLKELTGTLSAKVLGEAQQVLVVENVLKAKGKSAKAQGGEISVTDVTKDKDGVVTITFEFEQPGDSMPEVTVPAEETAVKPAAPGAGPGGAGGPGGAANKAAQDEQAAAKARQAAEEARRAILARAAAAQARGGAGGGVIVVGGPGMVVSNYAPYGLTLVDAKGKVLPAAITVDWRKMMGGPGRPGGLGGPGGAGGAARKLSFTAVYRPADKDAPEPAKLVYTGRKTVDVSVPFTLKNVDLK